MKNLKKTGKHQTYKQGGFSIIELIIVIGMFTLLVSFAAINLLQPKTQASISAVTDMLIADIKHQQLKAMMGESEGTGENQMFGIRFEANRYILFTGNSFHTSINQFVVDLDPSVTLSINLPSGEEIVFSKGSGEILNFEDGQDTITIKNTISGEQRIITLNKYGAITVN